MLRENLFEREKVVEIPYRTHWYPQAIESIQFADGVPDDPNVLSIAILIAGVAAKRVVPVDMEAKRDMYFVGPADCR